MLFSCLRKRFRLPNSLYTLSFEIVKTLCRIFIPGFQILFLFLPQICISAQKRRCFLPVFTCSRRPFVNLYAPIGCYFYSARSSTGTDRRLAFVCLHFVRLSAVLRGFRQEQLAGSGHCQRDAQVHSKHTYPERHTLASFRRILLSDLLHAMRIRPPKTVLPCGHALLKSWLRMDRQQVHERRAFAASPAALRCFPAARPTARPVFSRAERKILKVQQCPQFSLAFFLLLC